jgi:DNA-binding NtrC family response regulator
MPATVVIVHDDPEFAEPVLATLRAASYDVVAFSDSMSGIDALEHPKRIELLITRVRFPAGTPNGAALARMYGAAQTPRHQGPLRIVSGGPAAH